MRVTLKTPRMTLRPMRVSDGDALHAIWGDAEAMRYWDWPPAQSAEVTRNVIARQVEDAKHGDAIYWSMCLDGRRAPIGACDLSDIDTHHRRAEIGYLLAREFWGQGLAIEALRVVVAYATNALKLERLSARTHSGNARSTALLKKLGFKHEGVLRAYVWREGTRRDCDLYGLLLPRSLEDEPRATRPRKAKPSRR